MPSELEVIQEEIFKFLRYVVPAQELEQWVYQHPELETLLSANEYLALLSINFRERDASSETIKILVRAIPLGSYYAWHTRQVLSEIAGLTSGWQRALSEAFYLANVGCTFLKGLILKYGPLAFDREEHTSQKQQQLIGEAAEHARQLLAWIDEGKIVLRGAEPNSAYWDDLRSEEEKQLWKK